MPYIGKSPVTGNYNSLDDISGSFNSSTTTFNLLVNSGTALTPVRAEALIISINGVIQEPTTDFTVSAATIIFTTAPASTDTFFGVVLGQQLDIAVPSDGTVSTAKIADGAVTMAKLGETVTVAKGGTGATTAAAGFTALASTQATVGDGSVSAPAITSSTASADSGIYFPAADTIGMVSGGTEQFRFGSNPIPGGNKNLIRNGNMTIAQRGSTVTSPANGDYTLDGWKSWTTGANAVNVIQDDGGIFTAGGSEFAMRIDCTTVESAVAADERRVFVAPIEAQDLQHLEWGQASAKPVTVSFGFRSPKSGTHYVALYQTDGDRYCWRAFTVASADTAEFFKITFAADASGRIDNNNAVGLFLYFPLMAGSNFEGGSDNTWATGEKYGAATLQNLLDNTSNRIYIGKVQLEIGSVATDFEFEDVGTTLNKCYRYFYRVLSANAKPLSNAAFNTATTAFGMFDLPASMRAIPTLAISDATHFKVHSNNAARNCSGVAINIATTEIVEITYTTASATAGDAGFAESISASATFDFTSEL